MVYTNLCEHSIFLERFCRIMHLLIVNDKLLSTSKGGLILKRILHHTVMHSEGLMEEIQMLDPIMTEHVAQQMDNHFQMQLP